MHGPSFARLGEGACHYVEVTKGMFCGDCGRAKVFPMASTTTKKRVLCAQCEMPEHRCECERYCALCQGEIEVRLCMDGLYYCEACRQACDYEAVEKV